MKKKYRNNLNPSQSHEELRNQMAADGQKRLQQQLKQIEEEPKQQQQQGGGQFLNKIRKEIYNQNDQNAYQDRIKRNRHFQERFNE
ncbi:unnamed protein product [Paramecium pentaurelia]|nr:unnamed protein product [Paramecium pentaurelia]